MLGTGGNGRHCLPGDPRVFRRQRIESVSRSVAPDDRRGIERKAIGSSSGAGSESGADRDRLGRSCGSENKPTQARPARRKSRSGNYAALLVRYVNVPLTSPRCQLILDIMTKSTFAQDARTLVANIEDLLNSPNARDRVRAIHHLALGIKILEREVIADARNNSMSWASIGSVYGTTRQAVQQRFGDAPAQGTGYHSLAIEADECSQRASNVPA
jgi:hypothetical protein